MSVHLPRESELRDFLDESWHNAWVITRDASVGAPRASCGPRAVLGLLLVGLVLPLGACSLIFEESGASGSGSSYTPRHSLRIANQLVVADEVDGASGLLTVYNLSSEPFAPGASVPLRLRPRAMGGTFAEASVASLRVVGEALATNEATEPSMYLDGYRWQRRSMPIETNDTPLSDIPVKLRDTSSQLARYIYAGKLPSDAHIVAFGDQIFDIEEGKVFDTTTPTPYQEVPNDIREVLVADVGQENNIVIAIGADSLAIYDPNLTMAERMSDVAAVDLQVPFAASAYRFEMDVDNYGIMAATTSSLSRWRIDSENTEVTLLDQQDLAEEHERIVLLTEGAIVESGKQSLVLLTDGPAVLYLWSDYDASMPLDSQPPPALVPLDESYVDLVFDDIDDGPDELFLLPKEGPPVCRRLVVDAIQQILAPCE